MPDDPWLRLTDIAHRAAVTVAAHDFDDDLRIDTGNDIDIKTVVARLRNLGRARQAEAVQAALEALRSAVEDYDSRRCEAERRWADKEGDGPWTLRLNEAIDRLSDAQNRLAGELEAVAISDSSEVGGQFSQGTDDDLLQGILALGEAIERSDGIVTPQIRELAESLASGVVGWFGAAETHAKEDSETVPDKTRLELHHLTVLENALTGIAETDTGERADGAEDVDALSRNVALLRSNVQALRNLAQGPAGADTAVNMAKGAAEGTGDSKAAVASAKRIAHQYRARSFLLDVSRFTEPIRHALTLASDADLLARHEPDRRAQIGEFWAGARLDEYECQPPDTSRDEYLEAFRRLADESDGYVFGKLRLNLDAEVPPGFWHEVVGTKSSGCFAARWLLFLHVLGWQEPRATRYPCDRKWLEGHSLGDERYCLRSSLPDAVGATMEAVLFAMASDARLMLEAHCRTGSQSPDKWREMFLLPDLSEEMAFREDLPAGEQALTALLHDLAERMIGLAEDLCKQFPWSYLTWSGSVDYQEIVQDMAATLDKAEQAVWSQPGLGPGHAEKLRQRFQAIQATAREYPGRLRDIVVEYRRCAHRVLTVYVTDFGGDLNPLYEEIERQGGLRMVEHPWMVIRGVRDQLKTISAIAKEMRLAYTGGEHAKQRCQSDFRDEVLRFVELLVTLNNGIVGSCSPAAPDAKGISQAGQAPSAGATAGDERSRCRLSAQEQRDRVKHWVALEWYRKHMRGKRKVRKRFCELSGLPYHKEPGKPGIDTLERWVKTPTGRDAIKRYKDTAEVRAYLVEFKQRAARSNTSDASDEATSE